MDISQGTIINIISVAIAPTLTAIIAKSSAQAWQKRAIFGALVVVLTLGGAYLTGIFAKPQEIFTNFTLIYAFGTAVYQAAAPAFAKLADKTTPTTNDNFTIKGK